MDEFVNKLIVRDEAYQNGMFPQVPNFRKQGSAFILTGGTNNDIEVNERTTNKQIRQGKYSRLIEIITAPYIKEITFASSSKEASYSFDVYIKAVIQVDRPVVFYSNRNVDVDSYFENLFSLDVRKITRLYSILDYDGLDSELTDRLSAFNNIDESTGFTYRISAVYAEPGKSAQEYVRKHSTQQLDAGLKINARKLSDSVAKTYKEAIEAEVIEGKLSEAEAILKVEEYESSKFDTILERMKVLREEGVITDHEVKKIITPMAISAATNAIPQLQEGHYSQDLSNTNTDTTGLDEFYHEDTDQ